jgi:DNA (cytosine-5)-methyltransferase 1
MPTLRANQGGEGACIARSGIAARLMPVEWERLQGFPDGYTDVTYKGRPASDKRRTTALGNSFPVPMLRWIGRRIARIEEMDRDRR